MACGCTHPCRPLPATVPRPTAPGVPVNTCCKDYATLMASTAEYGAHLAGTAATSWASGDWTCARQDDTAAVELFIACRALRYTCGSTERDAAAVRLTLLLNTL